MKILIICYDAACVKNNTGKINKQSAIYAYHFNKWLSTFKDCVIDFCDYTATPEMIDKLEEHDFSLVLVNRGIRTMRNEVYTALRKKIKYNIITICSSNFIVSREDLLLFILGSQKPKTLKLTWGADFDLLKPQKPKIITILIDHKYYGRDVNSNIYKKDRTEILIKSLLKYKNEGHNITIRHIGNGKVHEVTNDYKIDGYRQGTCMDFREIYKYYNEAHIYIVTHPECFGLTPIECASSGGLIVQPNGYIINALIKRLHHVTLYDLTKIDWDSIIKCINIKKSIEMAHFFSYQNAVTKLHTYMSSIQLR